MLKKWQISQNDTLNEAKVLKKGYNPFYHNIIHIVNKSGLFVVEQGDIFLLKLFVKNNIVLISTIFQLQRTIADAPRGAVSLQGGAPPPRVPSALQGAVLTRQCSGLHARLGRTCPRSKPTGFYQVALERSHFCPT